MLMNFAHRGLYTCIPYLIDVSGMYNNGKYMAAKYGHAGLMVHATGMPRAQADMWS